MKWEEFKEELMQEEDFRKEWDALELEYRLLREIIERRKQLGITQEALSQRIGMKQSAVARLESGRFRPSITTLRRVAKGLDAELQITLRPLSERRLARLRERG